LSSTYFLYSARKSAKHVLFFISGGIFDQIYIALYFNILATEFERAACCCWFMPSLLLLASRRQNRHYLPCS